MSAVWKNGPQTSTERFVLLALADRADQDGYCWPAFKDIADRCAISRSTAIRAINSLEENGWLKRRVRLKNKSHERDSNGYYLNFELLQVVAERDPGSSEVTPPSSTTLLPDSTVTPPSSTVTPQVVAQCYPNPHLEPSLNPQGEGNARARNVTVITQDPGPAAPPPPQEIKPKSKSQSKPGVTLNIPEGFEFPEDPEVKRAQAEMIHAVAEVTGMDAKLNFGVLLQPTLDLVLAGYRPDQIRDCYGRDAPPGRWHWYRDDWRGKKGDMPTLKNIVETVGGGVAQSAPAVKQEGGTLWLSHVKDFRS